MAEIFEVIAPGLNLRAMPKDGAVVAVLPKGQAVEKLEESKEAPGWWKVRTRIAANDEDGYVSREHLLALDPKRPFRIPFLANLQASFKRLSEFAGPYAAKLPLEALPDLNKVLGQYGINKNAKRFTHFMAQLAHESGHFAHMEENLKYSGDQLWLLFRKYFKDEAEAQSFARQPEKIANRVYANRMDNGDEASGDGWRYRGRGFLQLTGRKNYREVGKKIGVDIEANPDLVASDFGVALKTACVFWDMNGLNALADQDDLRGITKKINGGYNGLDDRQKLLDRAREIWG